MHSICTGYPNTNYHVSGLTLRRVKWGRCHPLTFDTEHSVAVCASLTESSIGQHPFRHFEIHTGQAK